MCIHIYVTFVAPTRVLARALFAQQTGRGKALIKTSNTNETQECGWIVQNVPNTGLIADSAHLRADGF